jgi:hypothetical protein
MLLSDRQLGNKWSITSPYLYPEKEGYTGLSAPA